MATKCAINGRQWGAYDGRRHASKSAMWFLRLHPDRNPLMFSLRGRRRLCRGGRNSTSASRSNTRGGRNGTRNECGVANRINEWMAMELFASEPFCEG